MTDIKHVGRIKSNGRKVLVAYRTLPGESDSALIIQTENLSPEDHDALITLVEGNAGQNSYEFAETLARSRFSDGSVMLNKLHFDKKLIKVKTSEVEMTPNTKATIGLDQLNQLIAEQRGVSVNDLALGNSNMQNEIQTVGTVNDVPASTPETLETVEDAVEVKSEEPLSDTELAKQYRSQADSLYKEAARLRAEAEVLAPTKKKVAAKDSA
jgi:hypothetical protein